MTYHKKFVAVDLETTHLDMREGRIMEVGAVKFELIWDGRGVSVNFGKSFSSLVNPEVEPSETALTITGINKTELLTAPKWMKTQKLLKDFIGTETIVGHNIGFDIGYLENQGLKLNNETLDTLELARTLLPLEISHSLESLAEGFAVLTDAPHRALVDCQNTAKITAEILNEFLDYPESLQQEMTDILGKSKIKFIHMLADLPSSRSRGKQKRLKKQDDQLTNQKGKQKRSIVQFPDLVDKTIYFYPLSFNHYEELLEHFANNKKQTVVSLSHKVFLSSFSELSLGNPRFALCDERFAALLTEEQLSPVMAKILAKISVLKKIKNSRDLTLLKWAPDEFEKLHYLTVNPWLCPGHLCGFARSLVEKKSKSMFTDLTTLFSLTREWNLESKTTALALFDLSAIEDQFTDACITTWNLKKIRNLFNPLYPIEKNDPSFMGRLPSEVETILNELDLFFGILHLVYLKREGEYTENLLVDENERTRDRFDKLVHPAEKLSDKIETFTNFLNSEKNISAPELQSEQEALCLQMIELKKFLREFFLQPARDCLPWLKFNSLSVDLNLQRKDIPEQWKQFADSFETTTIIDTALPQRSRNYFINRLGLDDYKFENSFANKELNSIPVKIFSKDLIFNEQIEFFSSLPGRAMLLLPNELSLQKIYQALKTKQSASDDAQKEIFAYKFSGNVGVLKKKLAAYRGNNFLLLLTIHALTKHWQLLPELSTLVILKLPFEAKGSVPTLLSFPDGGNFMTDILPRAQVRMHRVISEFLKSKGENKHIFLLDPRILTDYDQSFRTYLEEFPEFTISTD